MIWTDEARAHGWASRTEGTRRRVYQALVEHPGANQKQIAEAAGLSRVPVRRRLDELLDEGAVIHSRGYPVRWWPVGVRT